MPVANDQERKAMSFRLTKQFKMKFTDDHLWFSIFSYSKSNHLTRIQRCTVCFLLFILSLLFNILYYDLSTQSSSLSFSSSIQLGPLIISLQQVCFLFPFLSFSFLRRFLDNHRCDGRTLRSHSESFVSTSISICLIIIIQTVTYSSLCCDLFDDVDIDLLHYRTWIRIWRRQITTMAHFDSHWVLFIDLAYPTTKGKYVDDSSSSSIFFSDHCFHHRSSAYLYLSLVCVISRTKINKWKNI